MATAQVTDKANIEDFQQMPNPGAPPAGITRLYADSTTGQLTTIVNGGSPASVPASVPGINTPLATVGQGYLLGPAISDFTNEVAASASGTTLQLKCFQFVCPVTITIRQLSVNVVANSASTTINVGIYSADGSTKLLDANLATAATGVGSPTVLGTPVTLQAGTVYWYVTASASTAVTIAGTSSAAPINAVLNAVHVRQGTAANPLVGTTLPSALGTVTASNFSLGLAMMEP